MTSCQLFCHLLTKNALEEAKNSYEVRNKEVRDDTPDEMLTEKKKQLKVELTGHGDLLGMLVNEVEEAGGDSQVAGVMTRNK